MKTNQNYSVEHIDYLKGLKRKKILIHTLQASIFVLVFGLWELLAYLKVIDVFDLSCPSRIVKTCVTLVKSGELWSHIATTLLECILGFALSTLIGVAIAIALWYWEILRKTLQPYIIVLNSLPKVALGPLLILWIGAGLQAIVAMAILISVIITIISALNSFMSCDENKILLMRSMGARKGKILTMLIIPRSVPDLMSIIKVNVGLAWVGTIMGEYISSRAGLGHLIVYGSQVFNSDLVMTATVILCLLAGVMYLLVSMLEMLVLRRS